MSQQNNAQNSNFDKPYNQVEITKNTFKVTIYATNLGSFEMDIWRFGKLKYGIYCFTNIPFFLFEIQGWQFAVPIKIYEGRTVTEIHKWIDIPDSKIEITLIDADSTKVVAVRTFGTRRALRSRFRFILEQYAEIFFEERELEEKIIHILNKISPAEMISFQPNKFYQVN
jgi:hypothetical protein